MLAVNNNLDIFLFQFFLLQVKLDEDFKEVDKNKDSDNDSEAGSPKSPKVTQKKKKKILSLNFFVFLQSNKGKKTPKSPRKKISNKSPKSKAEK